MDIMELGAIGELVGGVAVVASLIFVGIQVRQAASATRASVAQDALISAAGALEHVSSDRDRAALFYKGMGDFSSLAADEFPIFHLILGSMCRRWEAVMEYRNRGTLDESAWIGARNALVGVVRTPGFREWWTITETLYNPAFREFVRDAQEFEEDPEWMTRIQAHMTRHGYGAPAPERA